jgi:hypothetical protein
LLYDGADHLETPFVSLQAAPLVSYGIAEQLSPG